MLGPDATPARSRRPGRQLGLDRPLHEQLLGFYGRVLRGDLGHSYFLDRPVTTRRSAERAEPTVAASPSARSSWRWSSACRRASSAAANRGSVWDRVLMFGALLGVCIPGFWLSLNFIYLFAVRLGWLPAAGYASVFVDPAGRAPLHGAARGVARLQPVGAHRAHRAAPACSRCCSRTTSAPPAPRASPRGW